MSRLQQLAQLSSSRTHASAPCGVIQLGTDVLRLHVCSPAACREAHTPYSSWPKSVSGVLGQSVQRGSTSAMLAVPHWGEMYCNTCIQACIHSEADTTYQYMYSKALPLYSPCRVRMSPRTPPDSRSAKGGPSVSHYHTPYTMASSVPPPSSSAHTYSTHPPHPSPASSSSSSCPFRAHAAGRWPRARRLSPRR